MEKEASKRILPKFWFCLEILFGFSGIVSIFSGNFEGIISLLMAYWFWSLSKRIKK